MKTKESEIFEPSQKCCFALSAFTFGSKTVVELLQPPTRRQYAVEQILNAHSPIFVQHHFNVDIKGAALLNLGKPKFLILKFFV
jgi:hypothetical protein